MTNSLRLFVLRTIAAALGAAPVSAGMLRVGSNDYPTIQAALDHAGPGDTVRVPAGVYRERVHFARGGTEAAPVVLEGEPGATIDGSTPDVLDWQPMPEIGPGVYHAKIGFVPFTVGVDGKVVTLLDERRTDPARSHPKRDNIRWPEAFRRGVGPSGWGGVRALAMYRTHEGDLLLGFEHATTLAPHRIQVGPREPCVSVIGANWTTVRGLRLEAAAFGVLVEKSEHVVIEHCLITQADYGIRVGAGAARCTIRHNEIAYAPYAGADFRRPGQWDAWEACKNGGFYDRYGIRLAESAGAHDVHDNFIHDHWDGIEVGEAEQPEADAGIRIHHNRLLNIFDDGFETSGGQTGTEWYENVLEHIRCACRIKDPRRGPFYIYRNLFLDNGEDLRNWAGSKGPQPVEVWVYHNTTTSDAAVTMNYNPGARITTPGYHFLNNLQWCRRWVARASTGAKYPLPDWKGDYNVFVCRVEPGVSDVRRMEEWKAGQADAAAAKIDQNSTWVADRGPGFVDTAAGNLALTADSPARGRGGDLSGLGLPGAPGGPHPDAGALQFGEAMPKLPRQGAPALSDR